MFRKTNSACSCFSSFLRLTLSHYSSQILPNPMQLRSEHWRSSKRSNFYKRESVVAPLVANNADFLSTSHKTLWRTKVFRVNMASRKRKSPNWSQMPLTPVVPAHNKIVFARSFGWRWPLSYLAAFHGPSVAKHLPLLASRKARRNGNSQGRLRGVQSMVSEPFFFFGSWKMHYAYC